MLPWAMQPSGCCSMKPFTFNACSSASKLVGKIPFNKSIVTRRPNPSSFQFPDIKFNRDMRRRNTNLSSASSAATVQPIAEETDSTSSTQPVNEKLGVVVKPMETPRLVLKFIWMENNIGLALDRVIPGHGSIPLSPYYFWPRRDAWEELKVMLESKPWISQRQIVILLNQATDVINLWQQSSGDLS